MPAPVSDGPSRTRDAGPARDKRSLSIVLWIFPGFFGLFGVVFVLLLRVIPPPRPDVGYEYITQYFDTHRTTILVGLGLLCLIFGGHAVANGFVTYHMRRMSSGPTFAYLYMAGLAVGTLPGMLLVAVCWGAAAMRPDREPRIIALLYDLGMLSFNGSLGCFAVAYLAFAIAILVDKNHIFPKWLAYLTVWQIITEVIATQMWQQTSGPFAWNGSIAFWLAVIVFGAWLNCQFLMLKKATDEHP
ncbi:hypothetical protein AU197_02710 [Mycobacterium sp. IS-1590]|nr:hypothetical protein [Mycobacterium sp. IS-1590]KUI44167.1 hypothetical protein AU197_02710 [Mycobacterium sp. IS-1590]